MSRRILLLAFAVWVSILVPVPSGAAAVGSVTFEAIDYGFKGPDTLPAGVVTIKIVNNGKELHHVQLLRLADGKTAADFGAALKADGHPPTWISFRGGPNAAEGGATVESTVALEPGNYVLICLIPDPKGTPHVALGMIKALTVTPAANTAMTLPQSDITIAPADFKFNVSRPLTPGPHTFHVENQGTQPHEVVLVALAPGKTIKAFAAAMAPGASGPPPGHFIGGVVGLDPRGSANFSATLKPGNYGLMCFFPDPATGKEHFMLGMLQDISVK